MFPSIDLKMKVLIFSISFFAFSLRSLFSAKCLYKLTIDYINVLKTADIFKSNEDMVMYQIVRSSTY